MMKRGLEFLIVSTAVLFAAVNAYPWATEHVGPARDGHLPGGISLRRARDHADDPQMRIRPNLTIRLDPNDVRWDQLDIPDNVVLRDDTGIKVIGRRRSSRVTPLTLGQPHNVNLFCPIAADADGAMRYPLCVTAVQFDKTEKALSCILTAAESKNDPILCLATVEVYGEQLLASRTIVLDGRGRYQIDMGDVDARDDAMTFRLHLEPQQRRGQLIDGVQVRLMPEHQVYPPAAVIMTRLDVLNRGSDIVRIGGTDGCELIVDGHRYLQKDVLVLMEPAVPKAHELRLYSERRMDVPINGDLWISQDRGQPLSLEPGRHEIAASLRVVKGQQTITVTSNAATVWVRGPGQPELRLYYGRIRSQQSDVGEARRKGLSTVIVRWDRGVPKGRRIAEAGDEGLCVVPIDDADIDRFRAGDSWLTVHLTKVPWDLGDPNDEPFPFTKLSTDRSKAGTVVIGGPAKYWGRVLFDNGNPAILDPPPWPGAKVHIDIMAGQNELDAGGYFFVLYGDTEYAKAVERDVKFNIYMPVVDDPGSGRSVAKFRAEALSKDKTRAGVVKVYKPIYQAAVALEKAPLLRGKPLPAFEGIEIDWDRNAVGGRAVLVCFWDVKQRSSRHMVAQLAKRASSGQRPYFDLILIQTPAIDAPTLNRWLIDNNVKATVGSLRYDVNKTRYAWGVRALPWMILTNFKSNFKVVADGFELDDLELSLSAAYAQ